MTDESGLDYSGYLLLPELLSLQRPLTPPEQSHVRLSEHLFIVVHQACEIWLRQILLDLRSALDILQAENSGFDDAVTRLRRATSGVLLLAEQTAVLEWLPEEDFLNFRPRLGTASGQQSTQFHELFRLTGLIAPPGPVMEAVRRIAAAHGTSPDRLRLDHEPPHPLYLLADAMDGLAVAVWHWQITHVKVTSRLIGDRTGTAGSSGARFLRDRTRLPFPDLRAEAP